MKRTLRILIQNPIVRYLFFGGLTVLVNLICFSALRRYLLWSVDVSNAVSIFVALLFAYVTNARFVFASHCDSVKERLREFGRFVGARVFTMLLELAGVHGLTQLAHWNDLVSKMLLQVVVIILNYLFSKLLVFKKRRSAHGRKKN